MHRPRHPLITPTAPPLASGAAFSPHATCGTWTRQGAGRGLATATEVGAMNAPGPKPHVLSLSFAHQCEVLWFARDRRSGNDVKPCRTCVLQKRW
jgi:hypothetical protein